MQSARNVYQEDTIDVDDIVNQLCGIIEFSSEGVILNSNENYAAMSGYSTAELIGKNHKVLCPGKFVISTAYTQEHEALRREKRLWGLYARQRKDGSSFWVAAAYCLVPAGKVEKIVKICVDVTDRMGSVLGDVASRKAMKRALFMAEYDPKGHVTHMNGKFLMAMGRKLEDVRGLPVSEIFAPGAPKAALREESWRNIKAGHTHSQLLACMGGNNTILWLETLFAPVFSDNGRLDKVVQIGLNVSARVHQHEIRERACEQTMMIAEHAASPVFVIDATGKHIYINKSFTDMFGYTAEDLADKSPVCILGPDEGKLVRRMREMGEHGSSFQAEVIAYPLHGQRVWVSALVRKVIDEQAKSDFLVAVLTDITETKLREVLQHNALEAMAHDIPIDEVLQMSCREVERIIPGVSAAVIGLDGQGRMCLITAPSLDWKMMEIEAFPLEENGSPSARAAYTGGTFIENDIASSSLPQRFKDLAERSGLHACLAKAIRASNGKVFGAVAFYYTDSYCADDFDDRVAESMARVCSIALEREEHKSTVQTLTLYDNLTGLPNRSLLLSRANLLDKRQGGAEEPTAVLCVNIDRFRRVTKEYGFSASSGVLRAMAQRLQDLQPEGALLGSLSADEYVMIVPRCSSERALEIAKNIRTAFFEPCLVGDRQLILSGSVGISMRPEHGVDMESLVGNAAAALAQGHGGRGRIRWYKDPAACEPEDTFALETCLHHAIEEERLHLQFQPQVYIKSGGLYGVEALCRWHDHERGHVSPARFIALAEESGLIESLSGWVLRESCRQLGIWRKRGLSIPSVSINLSSVNFRDENLPERVLACLREHDLAPKDLILELTENVLLDDDPATINTVHKAHAMGLRFSLDDFGTGYSSLSYLRHLPISEIKLDQSFVRDLHENEVSQRLSKAVLGIGKSLGLVVLAEGIENEAQYALLREQEYHVAQGFLLSQPVSATDLEDWLKNWSPKVAPEQYWLLDYQQYGFALEEKGGKVWAMPSSLWEERHTEQYDYL